MNTMGNRELVSSAGHSRCLFAKDHRQVAGSRGRQKVKQATVQAGKRLVTLSGRSGNR